MKGGWEGDRRAREEGKGRGRGGEGRRERGEEEEGRREGRREDETGGAKEGIASTTSHLYR